MSTINEIMNSSLDQFNIKEDLPALDEEEIRRIVITSYANNGWNLIKNENENIKIDIINNLPGMIKEIAKLLIQNASIKSKKLLKKNFTGFSLRLQDFVKQWPNGKSIFINSGRNKEVWLADKEIQIKKKFDKVSATMENLISNEIGMVFDLDIVNSQLIKCEILIHNMVIRLLFAKNVKGVKDVDIYIKEKEITSFI